MEARVYAWSMSGEFLEAVPLAEFATCHDLDPRQLLTVLLLAQAVVGREPQPLVFDLPRGNEYAIRRCVKPSPASAEPMSHTAGGTGTGAVTNRTISKIGLEIPS